MTYLESLNKSLKRLMEDSEDVYLFGEDVVDPYGGAFKVTKGLSTLYPGRVISTPISEAAIVGIGAGMAMKGLRPIVEIMFGDFIALCTDQIVNGASKFGWMYGDRFEVPVIIRTPMGGRRGYGATHSQTLETLFMGVPGINIIGPSIYHDVGQLLFDVVKGAKCPTLFIENKSLYPQLLKSPDSKMKTDDLFYSEICEEGDLCPTISLKFDKTETPDVTLIAYGGMASMAVEAATNVFYEEEILSEVLIPSSIKPLPINTIMEAVGKSKRAIIVEESVKEGGWGAELSSQIYENLFDLLKCSVVRVGAENLPIPSSAKLEQEVLPQTGDIEKGILGISR